MAPSEPSRPASAIDSPVRGESPGEAGGDMSDEEYVSPASPEESSALSTSAQQNAGVGSSGGGGGKSGDTSNNSTPPVPMQKRRRVTRVYSYDCTYDKPSNRRRNPAPQYIEALESKLQRAETLLRKFMPDVDLNDPSLDLSVQQEFRLREQARSQAMMKQDSTSSSTNKDAQLMSMISDVGQLDLDGGDYDFHGLSSGTLFFRRMKEHFRTLLGRDYQIPFSQIPRGPHQQAIGLDSPRSSTSNPWDPSSVSGGHVYDLPPKAVARTMCSYALNYATCVLRIVHIPSFYEMLDNIYDKPPERFEKEDNRNLALVYSVIALGCMYNVSDDGTSEESPYEAATEEGLKYYTSARLLLQDITECRDLTSLQALLFMVLFIQSISNLSTCYGFVGIALRSTLRMGLHRHLPHVQVNPIESESRKRVFYVCRQLDIYVSALLGFPMLLNDEDVDQPLPTPVDDEYITKDGIFSQPDDKPSFFEAFNAHAQLMDILSKVIKHIYPLKGLEQSVAERGSPSSTYMISYSKVKEMEKDLQQWFEDLPEYWRPNSEGPEEVVRVRNLLRFAYAHVQMVLYRPFIHYVSPRVCAGKNVDERSYACGAAGISVARNIVHIGTEMRKQVSLVGPYWFTFYTEFFAIISLVFWVLENQDNQATPDIMADAAAGKEMITTLARRSMAADRIASALDILFEQIPENMKKAKAGSVATRKRTASGGKRGSSVAAPSPAVLKAKPTILRHQSTRPSPAGTASLSRGSIGSMQTPNVSFEPLNLTTTGFGSVSFSQNLTAMSPLDLTQPNADAVLPDQPATQQTLRQASVGVLNPLHRLDAMMFPSENPLEYPNQPHVEIPSQRHPGQHQDPSQQFYMPNMYDSIEGQLMGPLPPYIMQTAGQPEFGFPAEIYSDPMLPLQMQSRPLQQQQQQQRQQQHQPQQQQGRSTMQQTFGNTWAGNFRYE